MPSVVAVVVSVKVTVPPAGLPPVVQVTVAVSVVGVPTVVATAGTVVVDVASVVTVVVAKEAAQVGEPLYTAVIVCGPGVPGVNEVVTVAGEPVVGTVLIRVTPSKNDTEPPVVLPVAHVTTAVNVVGEPTATGFGAAETVVVLRPSGMMVSVVVPVAPAQFGFVLVYTAVIVCPPSGTPKVTGGMVNVRVSVPGPAVPTASVPRTVAVVVSVKTTEPVGSPSPVQVTTAVKVTGWSCVAGFGFPVRVTVVVVALTVTGEEIDGPHTPLPVYVAVTVWVFGGAVIAVVVIDAEATPPTGPPSTALPRKTGAPVVSKKFTVPVGLRIPPPGQVTVAVKVTAVPDGAVLGTATNVVVVVVCALAMFIAGATNAIIPASATTSTPTRRINNG
ncbi:MAG TPA: hypothetical protein VJT49_22735 [Amycolatopsis sp.]|nr:hypothetical protein [Amycolatopsis sp.]HKS47877.1 hypothetical protein [Amycolatopsis sp.]